MSRSLARAVLPKPHHRLFGPTFVTLGGYTSTHATPVHITMYQTQKERHITVYQTQKERLIIIFTENRVQHHYLEQGGTIGGVGGVGGVGAIATVGGALLGKWWDYSRYRWSRCNSYSRWHNTWSEEVTEVQSLSRWQHKHLIPNKSIFFGVLDTNFDQCTA
jgi:hypothetical protein